MIAGKVSVVLHYLDSNISLNRHIQKKKLTSFTISQKYPIFTCIFYPSQLFNLTANIGLKFLNKI